MGIHSHCQQTLPLQNSIIFLYHFPENSNVNSYCHGTDLKNNNGSLQFFSGLYTFLSGKPEMSVNLSTSMRNNTHLLTLQVNWATICQMRKHTTPMWPQLTSPDYFVFLQESLAKVLTNQSAPFTKAPFQSINKRLRCIKVGNGPLIIFVRAADWPTTNFLGMFCHFPVTKLVNLV